MGDRGGVAEGEPDPLKQMDPIPDYVRDIKYLVK